MPQATSVRTERDLQGEKSAEIAADALRTGKGVIDLVRDQGLLWEEQITEHLDPAKMVAGDKG